MNLNKTLASISWSCDSWTKYTTTNNLRIPNNVNISLKKMFFSFIYAFDLYCKNMN